jgi:signal peptidase
MNVKSGVRIDSQAWIVVGMIIALYCVINLALPRLPISGTIRTYIIQPVLWGFLSWVILVLPKRRPLARPSVRSTVVQLALIIGFFQVAIYVISGLFSGFGNSPYSFTPLSILGNLFFVGTALVGMELSRAWLCTNLGKRHTIIALSAITIIYTILNLTLSQITSIKPDIESISFLSSTFLPLLTENLLATLLALIGGFRASIAYRGILLAFWWFSPILPDPPWMFLGLIGTTIPVFGLIALYSVYSVKTGRGKIRKQAKEGFPAGWIFTSIIAVVIIWFSVGLFPFHPSLIASGSMRPSLDVGDIGIIAEVPADTIEIGDIIKYRSEGGISIIHRVIDIQVTETTRHFITKGDANDSPDTEPVIPENVEGRLVFTIPKVGWISTVIKSFFTG